ncbi:hypothetical protein SAMN02745121_04675 [Nannocystis exedens]|uniref:Lysozyme inhibitor LprI N-terminal domain-containing protein n=1 Tax=Nannocystis exedens TaxID=54 RepID=A0A1I2BHV6_9BACT|nr:hypothetical protein [Nannocystis exedens]PCC67982.1 hypothetical protein NAEX_00990 [Nannocystis exedens]SFE55408.1 hypothetical protein SAMN02745121_04675 [Nannocystis exedens]
MSLSRPCTLLCGLWLVACAAPESAPTPETKAAPPAAPAPEVVPPTIAAVPETRPEPPPAAAPPVAVADGKTGVAACDAYAERYRACIADKVPSRDRDAHTRALEAQLATWLAAKADPRREPALDGECAAATEAARATTRVFGCVWRDGDAPEPEAPRPGKVQPGAVETSRARGIDMLGDM